MLRRMSVPWLRRFVLMLVCVPAFAWAQSPGRTDPMTALEQELVAKHGEGERARSARARAQGRQDEVGNAGKGDGDAAALASFVHDNYAGDAVARDALFSRMEFVFESLGGPLLESGRDVRRQSDLDIGPIRSFDETLAAYDPGAHLSDDLFANKLAFGILLNFPLTSPHGR